MSGIEVAGLVFGVLPVLIEAVKAYSTVSDGLRTIRHWSKEVKSVSVQLGVQKGIFLNECRLLLQLVEDDKAAKSMLDDEDDCRWASKEINERLNIVLKNNVSLCCGIIEEMKENIDELREEMKKFDVLQEQKQKNEKIKSVIKRLRGGISIAFDKSKYEKCLGRLRDRNGDLGALRAQIGAFQQTSRATGALVKHRVLPARFQSIQNASQKLHEALCGAWCCDDSLHRGHFAKLCLDAKVRTEVHLDLAISCHDNANQGGSCPPPEPPIWLYVQSLSVTAQPCMVSSSDPVSSLKASLPAEVMTTCVSSTLKKKKALVDTDPTSPPRKKKTKRVHFNDATIPSNTLPSNATTTMNLATLEVNLCQTKNMCHYLQSNYRASNSSFLDNCVGYLETPQLYKHMFFAKRDSPANIQSSTVYSIFDIMQQDPNDVLEAENQLRLAHKAALAILQYYDTPWLPQRWRLGQMSYFGSRHDFDETALKTLHLSSQISSATQPPPTAMDGVERTTGVSDEIRYGINNLPLFFLGVALLEIAHWQPLEAQMTPQDDNDQVYAARRLQYKPVHLGPEYLKIAQKCLQCNFGFGTELKSKGLQAAVYNDVVCGLEGMLERLAV